MSRMLLNLRKELKHSTTSDAHHGHVLGASVDTSLDEAGGMSTMRFDGPGVEAQTSSAVEAIETPERGHTRENDPHVV